VKILFVHQKFPGQYEHQARIFAADPTNEVVALTMAEPVDIPGVRIIRHAWNRAQTTPHAFMTELDLQVQRGQSAAHAATALRSEGFTPDLILAHPAWGEALFLKDVFPASPLICYQEFYYNPTGSDIDFDPEFPKADANKLFHLRVRNANTLLSLAAADANLSPTRWQAAQFPQPFRERIRVIHDGIDTNVVRPEPGARVELVGVPQSFRPGDEVVTFVNRNFEPYRGFHSFIRAVPRILEARPNAQIICVGGDDVGYGGRLASGKSWRAHYLAEIADRVDLTRLRFVGTLPWLAYLRLLQVSACHVYLTYPFVLSWSLMEAMSAGGAVVGSRTAPVEEVIRDGENGLLADFFSPEEIADQVCRVLAGGPQIDALRRQARETIIRDYDLTRVCLPRLTEFYAEVCGGGAQWMRAAGSA
jgi:glycosyltransferase involved in cell wall biosynthesis